MRNQAPCGHHRRDEIIKRSYAVLFPTVFVEAWCIECSKSWTERYEFDMDIPINGKPREDQDYKSKV